MEAATQTFPCKINIQTSFRCWWSRAGKVAVVNKYLPPVGPVIQQLLSVANHMILDKRWRRVEGKERRE